MWEELLAKLCLRILQFSVANIRIIVNYVVGVFIELAESPLHIGVYITYN